MGSPVAPVASQTASATTLAVPKRLVPARRSTVRPAPRRVASTASEGAEPTTMTWSAPRRRISSSTRGSSRSGAVISTGASCTPASGPATSASVGSSARASTTVVPRTGSDRARAMAVATRSGPATRFTGSLNTTEPSATSPRDSAAVSDG